MGQAVLCDMTGHTVVHLSYRTKKKLNQFEKGEDIFVLLRSSLWTQRLLVIVPKRQLLKLVNAKAAAKKSQHTNPKSFIFETNAEGAAVGTAPGGPPGWCRCSRANFTGLLLGCIEADVCNQNIRLNSLKVLPEIYTIQSFAQLLESIIENWVKKVLHSSPISIFFKICERCSYFI